MTTPWQSGKAFEKEIDESLKYFKSEIDDKFYFWRIKDAVSFGMDFKQTRIHKVPADHLAIYDGIAFLIEDKSSGSPIGFDFKYIRDHQKEALGEFGRAGGKAFLFIARRDIGANLTLDVWALEFKDYVSLKLKGKVPWDKMPGERLEKVKGRKHFVWDLKSILKNFK